jgi:hypothetical protein
MCSLLLLIRINSLDRCSFLLFQRENKGDLDVRGVACTFCSGKRLNGWQRQKLPEAMHMEAASIRGSSWEASMAHPVCDFTPCFAASALIKLPQRFSFELKVGNEKEEMCELFPHIIAAGSQRRQKPAASW